MFNAHAIAYNGLMKSLANILAVCLIVVILNPAVRAGDRSSGSPLYFPHDQGEWETVEPKQVGWDGAKLQETLDYAGDNQSSGVVILYRGRILAEQYFEVQGARSAKYRERVLGRDETVLADRQYLKEATTTSQTLNPFYGYLW